MMMISTSIEGSCACGAIRYRAVGKPMASMICHCQSCRRSAGSPVVAWLTFSKEAFRFIRGQPSVLQSSASATRTFCAACGTPLTYENTARALEVDVTTCSLDDPEGFPPSYHAWLHDDLSWVRFGDDLKRFPESEL